MSRDVLSPEPYEFDDDFEQTVVILACRSIKFWERVGYEVEPDLLPTVLAQVIMRTARMVAAETSRPPSLTRVRQRLSTLYAEGKLSRERFDAAKEYLSFTPAAGDFEDAVQAELAPILQRRVAQRVAFSAAGEYGGANSAFDETRTLLKKLEAIGKDKLTDEENDGLSFANDLDQVFSEMVLTERLPWGVQEVDGALRGGIGRGCTALLVGSTGDGKSKGLIHAACTGIRAGERVVFATNEYGEDEVMANVVANLTGYYVDDVIGVNRAEATRRAYAIINDRTRFSVKAFAPQKATFDDVTRWAERVNPEARVMVIDYLDKLVSPERATNRQMNSYLEGQQVAESFRLYCKKRQIWGWSASQAQRRKDKKAILGTDDVGMSIGKAQVGDYLITLNYDKELDMVTYHVGKARWQKGRQDIGPLPHDWGRGRMCPLGDRVRVAISTAMERADQAENSDEAANDDYL